MSATTHFRSARMMTVVAAGPTGPTHLDHCKKSCCSHSVCVGAGSHFGAASTAREVGDAYDEHLHDMVCHRFRHRGSLCSCLLAFAGQGEMGPHVVAQDYHRVLRHDDADADDCGGAATTAVTTRMSPCPMLRDSPSSSFHRTRRIQRNPWRDARNADDDAGADCEKSVVHDDGGIRSEDYTHVGGWYQEMPELELR